MDHPAASWLSAIQHGLDVPQLFQVELASFLFTERFFSVSALSEQQSSSWISLAAPSVAGGNGTIGAWEAKAIAVKELSSTAIRPDASTVLWSLVGWASHTASSWSSDLSIWVACSWDAGLTAGAIVYHCGTWWASALATDETLS